MDVIKVSEIVHNVLVDAINLPLLEFKCKYIFVSAVCSNKDRYTLQKNDAVYGLCNKINFKYVN